MSSINEATLTKQAYFPEYYDLLVYDETDYYDSPAANLDAPENTILPHQPTTSPPPGKAKAETSDIRSYFPETWLWSLAILPSVFGSCGSLSGWFSVPFFGWFFSGREEGGGCV